MIRRLPTPPRSTDLPWSCWPLFPLWFSALALFLIGVALLWLKRSLVGPSDSWRPWFAWFPVTIQTETQHGRVQDLVWLQIVERRAGDCLSAGEHRFGVPFSGRGPADPGSRADAPSRCASRPAASIPSRNPVVRS